MVCHRVIPLTVARQKLMDKAPQAVAKGLHPERPNGFTTDDDDNRRRCITGDSRASARYNGQQLLLLPRSPTARTWIGVSLGQPLSRCRAQKPTGRYFGDPIVTRFDGRSLEGHDRVFV